MEKWKAIPDYEGFYEASNLGRIRSVDRDVLQHSNSIQLKRGKVLSPAKDRLGYLNVALSRNNDLRGFKVHKLIAICHVKNPNNYKEINHLDGNKENNAAGNLQWCTRAENIKHAVKNGLITYHHGDSHHNTKIFARDRNWIRKMFFERGWSVREIHKAYAKVNIATIYKIINLKETI